MSVPFTAGVLGPGAPELAAACAPLLGAELVLVVGAPVPGDGPATRRARRLARALRAGGGPAASAAGPVAWLAVEDAADARLAVRLAGSPAVLAVVGPRDAVADELLGDCAAVVVVAPEHDEVAALVLDELGARAGRVTPPGALERAGLRAGLPPAPGRRRALREALGA